MAYRITIDPAALREMKKIPPKIRQQIVHAIDALSGDPRPDGARKLTGSRSSYRIRVGEYRVLYRITDRELLVLVVKVGHRRDVYR